MTDEDTSDETAPAMPASVDEAPWGRKADGTPKRKPGRPGAGWRPGSHHKKPVDADADLPPLLPTGETRPKPRLGRPPKGSTARKSTAGFFSGLWDGVGQMLSFSGLDPGVGRVLQLEAVAAGPAIDALVAGTIIDKVVQPMLGKKASGEMLLALIGLPLLVGAAERNPALAQPLTPFARAALMTIMPEVVKTMKEAKKKEDKMAADLAELGPMLGKADGSPVTVDDIFGWIFAPAPGAEPGWADAA